MSETYTVTAKRWREGWELHIAGEGVTQTRVLAGAQDAVRDYLETLHDRDFEGAEMRVVVELGGLEEQVNEVRAQVAAAAEAQVRAGARARETARALRAAGISVSDAAVIMGVSRGRVSQLLAG